MGPSGTSHLPRIKGAAFNYLPNRTGCSVPKGPPQPGVDRRADRDQAEPRREEWVMAAGCPHRVLGLLKRYPRVLRVTDDR